LVRNTKHIYPGILVCNKPFVIYFAIEENTNSENEEIDFLDIPLEDNLINNNVLPHHVRCASHTLSLLATTDFNNILGPNINSKTHYSVIGKCTALWNASRRPKSSEIILDELGCSLIYPTPTRLNSMFDSLNHLITLRCKLNNVVKCLNLNFVFKESDYEYLEELVKVLKPIAQALDYLQSEKYCYYGQLIPTFVSLKLRLEELKNQKLRYLFNLISPLCSKLHDGFKNYFNLSHEADDAILATCFHPFFKMRWIPKGLTEADKERIQLLCINAAKQINIPYNEISTSDISDNEESFLICISPNRSNAVTDSSTSVQLQILQFFNDKNKNFTCLNNYSVVKQLFINYNTNICSSAPVERLFSFAGFIMAPTRSRLSDEQFEKLVLLKGNQNYGII